jgi:hypothetical protein
MKQKRHAGPMPAISTVDAITRAGSISALARLLGISRVAVHKWGETPPPARMWQLMQIRPEWFASEAKP